jgi:fluoroacetyl-CoA thioesterase
MKEIFKIGDRKIYTRTVTDADIAAFHGKVVHPVCSTFALARDMEWSSRLFVLEMKEEDEEGVGTFIHIEHQSPAFVNDELKFIATLVSVNTNEIVCDIEVLAGDRTIASGKTGQKILKKERLAKLFSRK